MLKLLSFLTIALLIIKCDTTNVSNSKDADNNGSNDTTYYRFARQQSHYENGDLRTTWYYEYLDNKLVKTEGYNSNNELLYTNKSVYDESGKRVARINYDNEDSLGSYYTFEYNELEILRKSYGKDSSFIETAIYNLDNSGEVTESFISINQSGDTISISYFYYDLDKKRTGRIRINSDGDTTGLSEYFYTGELLDSCVSTDLPSKIVGVRKFFYEEGKPNENIFLFGLW